MTVSAYSLFFFPGAFFQWGLFNFFILKISAIELRTLSTLVLILFVSILSATFLLAYVFYLLSIRIVKFSLKEINDVSGIQWALDIQVFEAYSQYQMW